MMHANICCNCDLISTCHATAVIMHIHVSNASSLHHHLQFIISMVCYNRMCEVKMDTQDVRTPQCPPGFDFSIYMAG